MISVILQGGVFVIPLLICSVLTIAIVFDRAIHLRRGKVIQHHLLFEIEDAIKNSEYSDVLKITAENFTPMMRIVRIAIINYQTGRENLKNSIEEAGRLEVPQLEKYLSALNTIAVIAPLFGLLGTVTGMIRVFDATVGTQSATIETLASGISEALISTAFGLIVALPALVFHSYFLRKVELLMNEMEKHSLILFNIIVKVQYPNPL